MPSIINHLSTVYNPPRAPRWGAISMGELVPIPVMGSNVRDQTIGAESDRRVQFLVTIYRFDGVWFWLIPLRWIGFDKNVSL